MNWGNMLAIASIVLALPLAIIGNMLTPKVKDWFVKRSVVNSEKRIMKLEQQLEEIIEYKNNTNKLLAFGILAILKTLILICLVSMIHFFASLIEFRFVSFSLSLLSFLIFYTIVITATRDAAVINKVYRFDDYQEELIKRIKKLKDGIRENGAPTRSGTANDDKELFIFHANSENKRYGNIWHNMTSGTYADGYLSTDLSKLAIYRLLELKELGQLSEATIIGLYFKDNGEKTACLIELQDFSYEQGIVNFSFRKVRDTLIKSHLILTKLGKKYSHYNGRSPQLIVRVMKDLDELLSV